MSPSPSLAPPPRSSSTLPPEADVAIIGAGFAGAATAHALAGRGDLRVVVLEQAPELGRYASGRSAGMGRQLAEDDATTALTMAGAELLRARAEDGVWVERGGILTFDDDAHLERYRQRAAAFAIACRPMRTRELQPLGVAARCGLWVPSDGLIDVLRYLRWLMQQAQARGAQLWLDTAVTAIDEASDEASGASDGCAVVRTSRGALRARVVVDAAGAWAGTLTGRSFTSLRRHVFAVATAAEGAAEATSAEAGAASHGNGPPPAQPLARLLGTGPFVWHLGAEEVYARPQGPHWLVSPCDERPGPPGEQALDEDAEPELRRRLARFGAPWIAAPVTQRWSCQRTFTAERQVIVERDPQRRWLVWAAALGGHGATAAGAVGARAAALVAAALAEPLTGS